jgi:hypothetical protein
MTSASRALEGFQGWRRIPASATGVPTTADEEMSAAPPMTQRLIETEERQLVPGTLHARSTDHGVQPEWPCPRRSQTVLVGVLCLPTVGAVALYAAQFGCGRCDVVMDVGRGEKAYKGSLELRTVGGGVADSSRFVQCGRVLVDIRTVPPPSQFRPRHTCALQECRPGREVGWPRHTSEGFALVASMK